MPKLTVLEKAIQQIEDQISALQLAKKHLQDQVTKTTKKKPVMRAVSGSD